MIGIVDFPSMEKVFPVAPFIKLMLYYLIESIYQHGALFIAQFPLLSIMMKILILLDGIVVVFWTFDFNARMKVLTQRLFVHDMKVWYGRIVVHEI